MKRIAAVVGLVGLALGMVAAGWAGEGTKRPRILGIAGVQIHVENPSLGWTFYSSRSDSATICVDCGDAPEPQLFGCGSQTIAISSRPGARRSNLLEEVVFNTEDLRQFGKYLKETRVRYSRIKTYPYGDGITTRDPEGHDLLFVSYQSKEPTGKPLSGMPRSCRLIHAGFVVKDRGAMDKFYRDILGFRLYWTGGMKDGETDWVDMQVPDGTDWIEYMLNIPADADKRTLGVMNHIALGVPDVRAAAKVLEAKGMKLPEEPKLGRDGKWQLNLYDPDGTRVELMEFTPAAKPCCAEYTGDHPKP